LLLAPTQPLAILLALNLSLALQPASTPPSTKVSLKMRHTPAQPLRLLPAPTPPLELMHVLVLLPTAPSLLAPIHPPSLLHALLPVLDTLLAPKLALEIVPTPPQIALFALTLPQA
jgi:hypothetical protein